MNAWVIFGIGCCVGAAICFALACHFNAMNVVKLQSEQYRDEMYRLRVKHEGWRRVDGLPLPMPPRDRALTETD